MNRSQKIRRLYEGSDRLAKMMAMGSARAQIGLLESVMQRDQVGVDAIAKLAAGGHQIDHESATRLITQNKQIIEVLARQIFVIAYKVPFELRMTGDSWSPPLYVRRERGNDHWLYRVLLADNEEAQFVLSRTDQVHL